MNSKYWDCVLFLYLETEKCKGKKMEKDEGNCKKEKW
jgi:hypothetical protein